MKVLIADPDPGSRDVLRRVFAQAGDQVRGVATLSDAEKQIAEFLPDAVVAAWEFPGEDAGRLLDGSDAAAARRGLFVLVDQNGLADAVAAMERGAEDFLWRPVSPGRVAILRAGFLARRQRERLLEDTRLALARAEMADALPGRSSSWQAALATIEREAVTGEPVLITGEAGTEKEPAARALHRLSARGSEPFLVAVAGEILPATSGATIFVPGVERGSAAFQRELLAELHGPSTRRLILGTDQDPRDPAASRLMPELYEILRDHLVHLPPLRERRDDVEFLARRFLYDLGGSLTFDAEAMDALRAHDWPGNVRELKEVVRRVSALADGPGIGATVVTSLLGRPLAARRSRRKRGPVVRIAVGDSLADVERRLIQRTLAFALGNKKKTAELLKLSLKTIYNKIKEYGLEH